MKNIKIRKIISGAAAAALCLALLAGCAAGSAGETESETVSSQSASEAVLPEAGEDDQDTTYSEEDSTVIDISDGTYAEIDTGGTYIITGESSDCGITVDAGDEEVQLVLRDVSMTSNDSAAIKVLSAGKVYVTLEGNNYLANGGQFVNDSDEDIDAVIYSKTDLTINGEGSLEISSPAGHGIVCKDEMVITDGTYSVDTLEDGINVNDSLLITGGTFTMNAGDDAIHTDGIISITGGTFDITAAEGLEGTEIVIDGGEITIAATDDGINAAQKTDNVAVYVEINGGNITITMGQGDTDGIDSNGDITITGGTIDITGMSAIDYDGTATFTGGTLIVNGSQTDTIPNQETGDGMAPGGGILGEGEKPGEPPAGEVPVAQGQPPAGDPPQGGYPG